MAKAKTVKIADVRSKSDDELKKELMDLRKEQFNLRIQRTTGQLENNSNLRQARRTIARIKTVQTERSKGLAAPEKASSKTAAKKPAKTAAVKKKKEVKE
jgi:large subunit ribosomal protein L29